MNDTNVESFSLDHTKVQAPYVRVADVIHLPAGDVLTKFDVRITQPNVEHLDTDAIHSLEHLMAHLVRNHSDSVVDVSPMGCRTGYYFLLASHDEWPLDGFMNLLEMTLEDVLRATEVPAANEVQCGWGAHHSLSKAKSAARLLLYDRDRWGDVFGDGR